MTETTPNTTSDEEKATKPVDQTNEIALNEDPLMELSQTWRGSRVDTFQERIGTGQGDKTERSR